MVTDSPMLEADFTSIDELNVIIAGDKPQVPRAKRAVPKPTAPSSPTCAPRVSSPHSFRHSLLCVRARCCMPEASNTGAEDVTLNTRLTRQLALTHPIISAPMAFAAGGRLASAVSDAGALGLLGGGYGDESLARPGTPHRLAPGRFGCGFITWSLAKKQPQLLDLALARKPVAHLPLIRRSRTVRRPDQGLRRQAHLPGADAARCRAGDRLRRRCRRGAGLGSRRARRASGYDDAGAGNCGSHRAASRRRLCSVRRAVSRDGRGSRRGADARCGWRAGRIAAVGVGRSQCQRRACMRRRSRRRATTRSDRK